MMITRMRMEESEENVCVVREDCVDTLRVAYEESG